MGAAVALDAPAHGIRPVILAEARCRSVPRAVDEHEGDPADGSTGRIVRVPSCGVDQNLFWKGGEGRSMGRINRESRGEVRGRRCACWSKLPHGDCEKQSWV